ncbi:MAG: hypothetical protein H7A46_00030 [Verrucomicrobiales bacterium]|nr:hypothetical protein [Verrucomicrobiales bacterium]
MSIATPPDPTPAPPDPDGIAAWPKLASLRDAAAIPTGFRWYRSSLARPPANGFDANGYYDSSDPLCDAPG